MIKFLIINVVLIFFTLCGYSQINLDTLITEKTPNCENIANNSTHLIMKYCNMQNYDSAKLILNFWQSKCGNSEPIIRTKILFSIKEKSFNEQLYDTTIVDFVLNYMKRIEADSLEYIYNYDKFYWGYTPINGNYDKFTQKLANDLLTTQNENSLEQLFCKFYSNILKNPISEIQSTTKYNKTKLKSYYIKKINKYINKPDIHIHIGVFAGVWIPTGNAKLLGNHPSWGFQGGCKYKKMTYDITFALKSLNSRNDYIILREGKLDTTNYFFGGYIGLDISRDLIKINQHQFDIVGGIAFDGFSSIYTNKQDNNPNNDKEHEIYSLNINLGLGYKYYFISKKSYIGLQGKYNFVNYNNKGGTDITGNCITFSLLLGGFMNNIKDYNLNRLRYNY